MRVCLRVLKGSNKSRFDSYSVWNKCIDHIPYNLPFRIVACTVFATTFLETAVYSCMKWVHCTFENFMVTTGKKESPHGYPRTTLKSHINFSNTSSVFQQKRPLHLRGLLHVAVSKKAWATTTMMTETTKWKAMGLIGKTQNSECSSLFLIYFALNAQHCQPWSEWQCNHRSNL